MSPDVPAGKAGDVDVWPSPQNPMAVARRLLRDELYAEGQLILHWWRDGWARWHGSHWRDVDEQQLLSWVYHQLEHAHYRDKEGALKPWSPKRAQVSDVMSALKAITALSAHVSAPAWLSGPGRSGAIISVSNGLLHVASRQLMDHTPRYLNHVSVPFAYDENRTSPRRWEAFLAELWPDDRDTVAMLQEWFGYVLSGQTNQQKIFLLVGPPRSGKGTIARVLQALIGHGNYVNPSMKSLTTNFGLQSLLGKPLAVMGDMRVDARHRDDALQALLGISGEDEQTIDRKYQRSWTGPLPTRFTILSNELPSFRDASGAIVSRFLTAQTRHSFLGQEDELLFEKLSCELPEILNWALEGLDQLLLNGRFTVPAASESSRQAMLDSASPLLAFVTECCEVQVQAEVSTDDLYAAYVGWCLTSGSRPASKIEFGRQLYAAVPGLTKGRLPEDPQTGKRGTRHLGIGLTRVRDSDRDSGGRSWG